MAMDVPLSYKAVFIYTNDTKEKLPICLVSTS